jgi:iron complex transport system ATP-binding protein
MHHGKVHALGSPRTVLTEANLSAVFNIPVHVNLDSDPPIIAPG